MAAVVSLISPGAMGSAVGAVLVQHGATVLTSFEGRSTASRDRAEVAGMVDAPLKRLAEADLILSIVPPAEAEAVVRRFVPLLSLTENEAIFIDCNALSPDRKRKLGELVAATGRPFIDGAIVGLPPAAGAPDPIFFMAGADADRAAMLRPFGLDVRRLDGPIGAAAALKMCYAGINKGQTGLGAAMLLAASRSGAATALREEMEASQADVLARFQRQIPNMYSKAYRWVAEMREIAAFLEDDEAAAMIFEGMARLYDRLAKDIAGPGEERALLDAFLSPPSEAS